MRRGGLGRDLAASLRDPGRPSAGAAAPGVARLRDDRDYVIVRRDAEFTADYLSRVGALAARV